MTEGNGPGPEYHEMMNDLNREHGLPYAINAKVHGFDVTIDTKESYMEFTVSKENSCYGEGIIKWDGCSNWDFNADGTMPHFCGLQDVMDFNAMMVELYRLASECIPMWNPELAE